MKKLLFILTLSFFSFHQLQAQTTKKELKHVVLFTFKASSSKASVDSVVKAFNHLYGTVPQVKNMEWGLNMSPEHLDQGFTHCFSLTFSNEKDLADYQSHPAHKDFQTILKPHMDKVFVVDYFVAPNN
ncbi:MAG: Dabb family protein [Chitinophagaceae bacterium]|nr:Dabb family protein [Chitinophagaceae bacterium]